MQKGLIFLLMCFMSYLSCSRRLCACDPVAPPHLKAVVLESNNIDCSRPLIKIDASDTAEISRVTGVYTDTYVASQLPDHLKTVGQKIYIGVAMFATGEDFTCTTTGPAYAHLKITGAISRN